MAKVNSQSKIDSCRRRYETARQQLTRYAREIGGEDILEQLIQDGKILKDDEAVKTAELDELFKLCSLIGQKVAVHRTEKARNAAAYQYGNALSLLERNPKVPGYLKLTELMVATGKLMDRIDNLTEAQVQPIFSAANRVFDAVSEYKTAKVVAAVSRSRDGWLLDKEGMPARHEEAFRANSVSAKVDAWLKAMPSKNADRRVREDWRQAGWDLLRGDLDHPWGMCACGKEKLFPWKNPKTGQWEPNKDGRDCYARRIEEREKPRGESPKILQEERVVTDPVEREEVEKRRAEEKRILKAQQRAAKLAARQRATEERDDAPDDLDWQAQQDAARQSDAHALAIANAEAQSRVAAVVATPKKKKAQPSKKGAIKGGQSSNDDSAPRQPERQPKAKTGATKRKGGKKGLGS